MDPNRLFGDGDYDDGEIYRLEPGTVLDQAIRNEQWLNYPDETRRKWLRLMNSSSVVFLGTVVSRPRRQIELTIVLELPQAQNRRWTTSVIVELNDFDRFLGPDPA